jgi:hypothetical protein
MTEGAHINLPQYHTPVFTKCSRAANYSRLNNKHLSGNSLIMHCMQLLGRIQRLAAIVQNRTDATTDACGIDKQEAQPSQ